MALPHHYLIALISPGGRLGQFHFALLAVLIAFVHLYIYGEMKEMPKDQPWNIYSIALLGLIWCKFCILSRRLHDTGSNGFIAIPVLLIAVIFYLYVIDPNVFGSEELISEELKAVLSQGMRVPRVLFIAVFVYCIRAGGESGPNGFGPEFGDSDDGVTGAKAALDKKRDTTMPVHSFKKMDQDPNGWGKRRRPTGFGRR